MTYAAVEFQSVGKVYGEQTVLDRFSLTIPKGKVQTIIGPSGCGKTTLLKMVNRLIEPDSGKVLVEGRDISEVDPVELRRSIGYVIQQIGLFPHMTIEENIALVPRLKGEGKKKLIERTEELLDLIGLDPATFRKRYPHELSGGQQQRIGVARALAADPSIVLMDEPFSALDPISRVQLQRELSKLNEQLHKTIIFVTHDIDEALKIGDRILLLKSGEIVQHATPEELLRDPANEFVREFVGPERYEPVVAPDRTGGREEETRVHELMTVGVTIPSNATASEAAFLLRQNGTEGLLVTDEELQIVGIVGYEELIFHSDSNDRIAGVMRTHVPHVTEHTPLSELFPLLSRYTIVPVLDRTERLIGAVTRSSVLEAAARELIREEVTV